MLSLPASVRVFVARGPTDMRKSFDALAALVREVLREDPLSGHLFVFVNRRRDRLKVLCWDRSGFVLLYKRLERGSFGERDAGEISIRDLLLLFEGLEETTLRARRWYARPKKVASA